MPYIVLEITVTQEWRINTLDMNAFHQKDNAYGFAEKRRDEVMSHVDVVVHHANYQDSKPEEVDIENEEVYKERACGDVHPLPCGLDEDCVIPVKYFDGEEDNDEDVVRKAIQDLFGD